MHGKGERCACLAAKRKAADQEVKRENAERKQRAADEVIIPMMNLFWQEITNSNPVAWRMLLETLDISLRGQIDKWDIAHVKTELAKRVVKNRIPYEPEKTLEKAFEAKAVFFQELGIRKADTAEGAEKQFQKILKWYTSGENMSPEAIQGNLINLKKLLENPGTSDELRKEIMGLVSALGHFYANPLEPVDEQPVTEDPLGMEPALARLNTVPTLDRLHLAEIRDWIRDQVEDVPAIDDVVHRRDCLAEMIEAFEEAGGTGHQWEQFAQITADTNAVLREMFDAVKHPDYDPNMAIVDLFNLSYCTHEFHELLLVQPQPNLRLALAIARIKCPDDAPRLDSFQRRLDENERKLFLHPAHAEAVR